MLACGFDNITYQKSAFYYEELDKCIVMPRVIVKKYICRLEASKKCDGKDV
jgi:hypothetical protein